MTQQGHHMAKEISRKGDGCQVLQILYGDCLSCMKDMDDESIGAFVSDPPYGIRSPI